MVVKKRYNRRKSKRVCNHLSKKLIPGTYFIDCDYEVAKVTEKTFWDVEGESCLSGRQTSCDYLHCRPEPISKERALELIESFKEGGYKNYYRKMFNCTEETLDKWYDFYKDWKPSKLDYWETATPNISTNK